MSKPKRKPTSFFDRAKKQVELQLKQAEDENRRNLLEKRIGYVTAGLKAYEAKKVTEAVINYQSFIKILEGVKGVSPGGLTPSHFDREKELGDLLLLVGIYWDLTKLFDHTKSDARKQEFMQYLEKFVLFSKGTSWQPMCAEILRRYLAAEKPKHRAEFRNAYQLIGDGKCFIVTALMQETRFETLPILWRFRDEVLMNYGAGRAFVRVYYFVGPRIAARIEKLPSGGRKTIGRAVDLVAAQINRIF